MEKLLTPEETAQILGITSETLNVWRATKRYPLNYIKIGRKVMYKYEDINNYINSNTINLNGSNG